MKISQKLEYACRALVQLARQYEVKTLTRLEQLAKREAVSANFLVQILNDLRRAGLIESRRGKSGGYLLAMPPVEITLRQVVGAVDPSLLQSTVSAEGESGGGVRQAWDSVSKALCKALDATTIADIAQQSSGPMFYI